jgi:hypothetical protein
MHYTEGECKRDLELRIPLAPAFGRGHILL